MNFVLLITGIALAGLYPLFFKLKGKSVPLPVLFVVLLAGSIQACNAFSLIYPDSFPIARKTGLLLEALLPPFWLWLALTYSRKIELHSLPVFYRLLLLLSPLFLLCALILPVGSFYFSPDFINEGMLFLESAGFFFYLFILIYLSVALVNLEITLVNSSVAARWKIKFELIGLGSILAGMIIFYGQGLLFRTLDINLATAQSSMLALAVAMMLYSRLIRGNGVKVYVSRQMAYKSVALLAVGIYLLGLGITGEGMKHFGNGFQHAIGITLGLMAGIGITILFLSENVRRIVKVFINKNFYRNKYDYRNQWLQFTDRLTSAKTGEELLRSIVTEFCETFGMRLGCLYLYSNERQRYEQRSSQRIPLIPGSFAAEDRLIVDLFQRRSILDLSEIYGPDVTATRGRPDDLGDMRFVIPFFIHDSLDGFLLLGKPMSREEEYNFEDFDLMKTLAQLASSTLLNLRLAEQLAKSREMAAAGRISAFVIHDLKNLCSTISLMLENASEHISNPDFQKELLTSLRRALSKTDTLIARLRDLPETQIVRKNGVDLLQLLHETAALVPGGELKVTGKPVVADGDREELQKVALNLMLNAVEATEGKKEVTVEVGGKEQPFFRVTDAGCGMPEEFVRKDLFEPFRTTKTKGLGIGLYQCKQIVEAHGGKIEVKSRLHGGSEFTVWLPKTESGLS